ncbi:MAG: GNAT family N-acetyltransferase [Myxococcota bacterium]
MPRHAEIQPMADRFVDLELDPRRRMWVAMGHGRPLGFIDAVLEHPDARSCTIQQVAVSPSHRFRGVGRSMVVVLENAAIEAGIHQLLAFVLSRSAGDFWRAVGFDESRPRLFVRRLEAHARTAPGA